MIDGYSTENANASERMTIMMPRASEKERTVSFDTNSLNQRNIKLMIDISINQMMMMNIDERHDIIACTHDRLHSRLEVIEYVSVTDV